MMDNLWLRWRKNDVEAERRQLVQEGRDISALSGAFDALLDPDRECDQDFQTEADALMDRGSELPMAPGYAFVEPSDLAAIRELRPDGPRAMARDLSDARQRSCIHGAWLGRCAGCLLGKPIESVHRPKLQALLDRADDEEITDYLWRLPGLSDEDYRSADFEDLLKWSDTNHMPEDDDTNYTVAGMLVVREKGYDFTPDDVARLWMSKLPIFHTCTAERIAYRNFVNNIAPPRSAVVRNPAREWIGAQIRADFFGYAAAGRPELAAELAWRDACVSHVKNGIYGEMWVAAMLAAAACEPRVLRCIEIGLSEIPARCRLAEAIRDVIRWHTDGVAYRDAVDRIHSQWDETMEYDWCHTISNAQVVALALLYGEGDFEMAITRAVLPCFDTDCNGATVGSIMGMMQGAEALPEKWTGLMNDTIHTGLNGYHVSRISHLAEEMFQLRCT